MRKFLSGIYKKLTHSFLQQKKWRQFQQELKHYVNEMNSMEDPWSAEIDKDIYARQLASLLNSSEKKYKILEVGCGQGSLTKLLLPFAKKITAIEISQQAFVQLRKKWSSSTPTDSQLVEPQSHSQFADSQVAPQNNSQNENFNLDSLLQNNKLELIESDIHQFFPQTEKYDLIVLSFILDYLGFNKFPQKFIQLMWQFTEHVEDGGKILIIHPVYKQADLHRLKAFTEIFKNFHIQIEKASTEQSSGGFPIHFILCAKYPQ